MATTAPIAARPRVTDKKHHDALHQTHQRSSKKVRRSDGKAIAKSVDCLQTSSSTRTATLAELQEGCLFIRRASVIAFERVPGFERPIDRRQLWTALAELPVDKRETLADGLRRTELIYHIVGVVGTETKRLRIGPVCLPVVASIYRLSLILKSTTSKMPAAPDLNLNAPPLLVVPGSIVVENVEELFSEARWPPTSHFTQTILSDEGLPSICQVPPFVSGELQQPKRMRSLAEFHREVSFSGSHVPAHYFALSEYFIGKAYFDLARYFPPAQLLGQTAEYAKRLLDHLRGCSWSALLSRFLAIEKATERFIDGDSLVRFVFAETDVLPKIYEMLPSWMDRDAAIQELADKPRGAAASSAWMVGLMRALAEWLDLVRAVYMHMCGESYSLEGAIFHKQTITNDKELQCVRYLVELGMMQSFVSVASMCNPPPKTLIDGAMRLAKYGFGEVKAVLPSELAVGKCLWWHPCAAFSSAFGAVESVVTLLGFMYEAAMDAYMRERINSVCTTATLAVRLSIFEVEKERIRSDKSSTKNKERLERICASQEARARLHDYEECAIVDAIPTSPLLQASLRRVLLSAEPIPRGVTAFWERLKPALAENPFGYVGSNATSLIQTRFAATNHSDALTIVDYAIRFPIVFFDLPQSNFGELAHPRAIGRQVEVMLKSTATYNFGPEDVNASRAMSTNTCMHISSHTKTQRILALHEAEKFTISEIKELLVHAFSSVSDSARSLTLWVIADMSAYDMGGLSLLRRVASAPSPKAVVSEPVPLISLRACTVYESLSAGLAIAALCAEQSGVHAKVPEEIGDTLLFCEDDCDSIDTHGAIEDGPGVPLIPLYSSSLPRRRSRTAAAPPISQLKNVGINKLYLSSLTSWRELYTVMCYCVHGLVVVGSKEALIRLTHSEWPANFAYTPKEEHRLAQNTVNTLEETIRRPDGSEVTVDLQALYAPAPSVDLFTALTVCKPIGASVDTSAALT